ncbi:MAG: FAD-dependent oxidoreductase, partial [Planctomycetota bacterium]
MKTRARFAAAMVLVVAGSGASADAEERGIIVEDTTMLQMAYDVDVLVAGGSLAGVEAACAAAQKGASVLLIEARPYLGYDLCATQRLWLEEGERPRTALTRSIFGTNAVVTPMQVKGNLDRALLEAGVQFLTGCFAVDVLFADGVGAPAGVVMVNRSGRQIIRAKVTIDATCLAAITRCTDATFRPFTAGSKDFKYV